MVLAFVFRPSASLFIQAKINKPLLIRRGFEALKEAKRRQKTVLEVESNVFGS